MIIYQEECSFLTYVIHFIGMLQDLLLNIFILEYGVQCYLSMKISSFYLFSQNVTMQTSERRYSRKRKRTGNMQTYASTGILIRDLKGIYFVRSFVYFDVTMTNKGRYLLEKKKIPRKVHKRLPYKIEVVILSYLSF